MGFFNFSKYNDAEKALLNEYSQIVSMAGLPYTEAKILVTGMLDGYISESKKCGTYYIPKNMGDIILGDTRSDNPAFQKLAETIKQKIPRIRTEGVRDEDIRWWWNQSEVARDMTVEIENLFRVTLFSSELEKGQSVQSATEKVRKYHPVYDPIYGDPINETNTIHLTGDDISLPCELKNRINIYIEKRARSNAEKYKNEIEQSSSFNALIRREIKAGNL